MLGKLSLSLLALLLASAPAQAGPARAATAPVNYDGVWTIDATASSFFCPVKSKRLTAEVRGGQVRKITGLPSTTAAGAIGADGGVAFVLRLLGYTATVRGRMTGGSGSGDWSSNNFLCSRGDWRAAMR
jgi:hypothetical protein